MKVRLYYNEEKLKKIEVVLRDNFVIILPPNYYSSRTKTIHNPLTNMQLPLKLFPIEKFLKH